MQTLRFETLAPLRRMRTRMWICALACVALLATACADDPSLTDEPALTDDPSAALAVRDAGVADDSDASVRARLPPVDSVSADGPFATAESLSSGPRGRSGVFYPRELGRDGLEHPIFVWGCGGGSNPRSYATQLRRIASHGFVVIAEVSQIGDDGAPLRAALTWLTAENTRRASPFYRSRIKNWGVQP